MVGRHELTDAAWARIEPLLPVGRRGGRWRDHRQVINAILWQAKTGVPWRDLPERYGPWKTAHERLRKWTADGTWDLILAHVVVKDDAVGAVEWTISVDSSSVRAQSVTRNGSLSVLTQCGSAYTGCRCSNGVAGRTSAVASLSLPTGADVNLVAARSPGAASPVHRPRALAPPSASVAARSFGYLGDQAHCSLTQLPQASIGIARSHPWNVL